MCFTVNKPTLCSQYIVHPSSMIRTTGKLNMAINHNRKSDRNKQEQKLAHDTNQKLGIIGIRSPINQKVLAYKTDIQWYHQTWLVWFAYIGLKHELS